MFRLWYTLLLLVYGIDCKEMTWFCLNEVIFSPFVTHLPINLSFVSSSLSSFVSCSDAGGFRVSVCL